MPHGRPRPIMRATTRRQVAGLFALAAVVATVAVVVPPERAVATLERAHGKPVVLCALLVAAYLGRALAGWPITVLSAVVGYLFGIPGTAVAAVGTVVTAFPPYLIVGRLADGTTEAGPLGWAADAASAYIDATGDFRGVLAARLAPVHTDVVSSAAGLAGVGPRAFALATLLGELPWAVAAALAGASAARMVAGAATPLALVVGAGALAALLLAGPVYGRLVGPDREPSGAEGVD